MEWRQRRGSTTKLLEAERSEKATANHIDSFSRLLKPPIAFNTFTSFTLFFLIFFLFFVLLSFLLFSLRLVAGHTSWSSFSSSLSYSEQLQNQESLLLGMTIRRSAWMES